jgi:hypothetical protein
MHEATESIPSYDFRKEFSAIATPGVYRYLRECGFDPDAPPDGLDDCWEAGQAYIKELWRGLKGIQRDYRERGYSADFELYDIKDWTRESVASFVEQRLEDILDSCNRICPPFGADYFIQSEIGVFGDKRDLLERVGAIEDARKLVDRMRAEGAFDVAIERGVQLLFLKAIRTGARELAPAPTPETQKSTGETDARTKALPRYLDGVTVGRNVDWTDVGGILGQMRDYVLAIAPYPNRPLAVMSALATLSAVCGRRIYAPTGLNLALYLAMIAKTATGKDAPLRAVARFLHASGAGLMAQPGKTFTVSGFEQCLIDARGACVATCDEIGDNLFRKILSKKAMPSETAIKTFLMELSGVQDDSPPFTLTKRAANGVDKGKTHIVHEVPGASFSLIGASTPDAFYEALNFGAIGDGSLNRFLIIDADAPPDDENIVDEIIPVPASITAALSAIANDGGHGFDLTGGHVWPGVVSARVVWAPGAKERYKLLGRQARGTVRDDVPFAALYGRVAANALKVATLIAVSRAAAAADEPLAVTDDDIEMGTAMALEAAQTAADGAAKNMAGSEFEANCKTLLGAVDDAGPRGLKESVLHRKPGASKIETRKFRDACEYLTRTGQWECKSGTTGKRYIRLGGRVAVETDD